MKILIITSKAFYDKVKTTAAVLESLGHEVIYPNCIDRPNSEQEAINNDNFVNVKQEMFKQSIEKIEQVDAVLVINCNKNNQVNYIGGATFLEIYEAWKLNKKIFIVNFVANSIISDEILGFNPIILNGNCANII